MNDLYGRASDQMQLSIATIGIVEEAQDKEGAGKQGRVLVVLPLRDKQKIWAQVIGTGAGKARGFFVLPQPGDRVFVVLLEGMPEAAYVVGGLWNDGAASPENNKSDPNKNRDGWNNKGIWQSRTGHRITLDDTDGEEKVIVTDKNGNRIELDSKEDTISILAKKDIHIKAEAGEVKIICKKFTVEASEEYSISGPKGALKATSGGLAIEGNPSVDMNGSNLKVRT
jgi:uncharacterized protein involved in type VI secretion and phage assembly